MFVHILLLLFGNGLIYWYNLSRNSNAESLFFNLDYKKIRECFYPDTKEIAEYIFYPN
jgi:hypothetical protein